MFKFLRGLTVLIVKGCSVAPCCYSVGRAVSPSLRLINGEVMTWRLETRRAENNQARCGITGAQTAVIHPDWTEPLDHTSTIKTAKKRIKKNMKMLLDECPMF